jgi:hypothetical protein
MKNLNSKAFAFVIFAVFTACFCALAYHSGEEAFSLWVVLKITYKTIPMVLLVGSLFVSYAWRWKIFQGWLVPFPDLNGTWQGTIQTTWKNPETGFRPGPIPVILTIRQTFTRISCVMRTSEMTSRSFLADFWLNEAEQMKMLVYSYNSQPLPSVVDRSHQHEGTILFELVGDPVTKLKGIYWTARKTTGEVTLTFREQRRIEEFPSNLGSHPVSGQ